MNANSIQSFKSEALVDRVGNTCMHVTFTDMNGMESSKLLSMEDYIRIINHGVYRTDSEYCRIGTLPAHYYDGSVSKEDGTFKVCLFYPADKRAISFGGKHWFVPFPALVFFYDVKKGVLTNRMCFAVQTDNINYDTPLMRYPFGNVSPSGNICYGNIALNIPDIGQVEEAVDAFFMSVTNNDYYSEIAGMRQEKLLGKLKNSDVYPSEWLLGTEAYATVGDLLETL